MTNRANYDEWFTPRGTLKAIGVRFDLDPSSPGREVAPWTAERHFTKEDDGLAQPWEGRVWLNPPYSAPLPWAERMARHGSGVALVRASTETRYFQMLAGHADAMLLKKGRIRFVKSNGVQSEVLAPFPSAFFAFGRDCAEALLESSIPGIRVRLNRKR